MPLRRAQPLKFTPVTLSDAVDGTNAPAGAMKVLSNLMPDPAMRGCFMPRPAAEQLTAFGAFGRPGFVSGLLVVGDLAYGMIATLRTPGYDEPFVFDLSTNSFITVAGVNVNNVPVSPPTSGDWTPPIIAQVGTRIVVTHPGFKAGGADFGWFDVSGFSETTTGNTATSTLITGAPAILGVQPGMTVAGTDIPANTTVVSTADFVRVTTGDTHTNTTLDNIANVTGVAIGQSVAGVGIPIGTTVANVVGTTVTLSQAATATAAGITVTFAGATITLSAAATGSTSGVTLTIAGGSLTAPLWGAGTTDRNPLPSPPVGVAEFNGRAYFALGADGIVFSDSGFACRVSNTTAVQALTTSDGLAVTAVAPLMLATPIVGGIVQALLAFEGATKIQQIKGDQSTSDLSMNPLPVATGTLAPLSIFTCSKGTGFVAPDGMRFVRFDGTVGDPIGEGGAGVTQPFQYALHPSRICAAATGSVIRISAQRRDVEGQPWYEYWYHLVRNCWTGPHTFPSSLVQAWRHAFVSAPQEAEGSLWTLDAEPGVDSVFTENGTQLQYSYEPTPMPDTGLAAENLMVEMLIGAAIPAASAISVTAADIDGTQLDNVTLTSVGVQTLWDNAVWDIDVWDGPRTTYIQRQVLWTQPLIFKQLHLSLKGFSAYPLRLGNVYMRYQILGYPLAA